MTGKSQFCLFFGSHFFSGVIVLEGECCVFKHCASVLWYVSFLVRVWWSSYIDSSICNVSLLSPLRLPLVKISLYHWFGQFCYYVHWFPSFLFPVFGNLLYLRVYTFYQIWKHLNCGFFYYFCPHLSWHVKRPCQFVLLLAGALRGLLPSFSHSVICCFACGRPSFKSVAYSVTLSLQFKRISAGLSWEEA